MYCGFNKSSFSSYSLETNPHTKLKCVFAIMFACARLYSMTPMHSMHRGHSKYSNLGDGSAVRKRDIWMRLQWVFSHIQLKGQAMIGSPWTRNCNRPFSLIVGHRLTYASIGASSASFKI